MSREKIATAVLELTTEHGAFFKDLDEVEKRGQRLDKSWRDTGKTMQAFGKQTSDLGVSLTTMTLPIAAIGLAAGKAAIDFESSFAGVRKTVNATEEEFAQLSGEFREMSKTIPVNVNELNRLGEAAGALGIPKEEISDFARVMALLGVTTNVTSDEAAESIAKIQNIFGAAGKDTDRFASTLVALGNDGASTEHQILELANRIASAGNAVGLTQGQVLGFASAIANVGIEAEAGGTAMSKTLIEISQAVSKGGADLQAFAHVAGVSSAAFAQAFKTDAAAATQMFIEGLGRIKNEGGDLNTVIQSLGVTEVRQSNLLRSLALSGDNVSKSLNLQSKAWQENTALTDESGKRFETMQSQLQLLWNKLQDVAITLGNALMPTLKLAVDVMSNLIPIVDGLVNGFTHLPAPIQATAFALAGLFVAAGPVLWAAGSLITNAGIAMRGFWALGNTVPVLTARVWLMESSFGSLVSGFASVSSWLASLGRMLVGWVGLAFIGLDLAIRGLTGNSSSLLSVLRDMATVAGSVLSNAISNVWSVLKAWADTMGTFLAGAAKGFLTWLRDSIPGLDTLVTKVGEMVSFFKLVATEGTKYWSEQAQLVRDQRKAVDEAASAQERATQAAVDFVGPLEDVNGRTQKFVAQTEAAKKAADEFAKSLKALGGADALAGAKEVLKQLEAIGGPLKVLPSKLGEMAEKLRAGAEAAMAMGNAKLANEYTLLAKTLDPVVMFQQRYNVTIGDFVYTNPSFLDAIGDQLTLFEDQVDVIEGGVLPSLMNLKKMWVQFAGTVTANKPFEKIWDGLGDSIKNLGNTILAAVQGGGSVLQAVGSALGKGLGEDLVYNFGNTITKHLGQTLGGAINAVLPGIGALLGPLLGAIGNGFKKLFGIGVNEAVRQANAEIDKLRNGLLDTYGPLDRLERKANLVGLSFERNWGHQGQSGLKAMNALIAEFERRTAAVADASERAVTSFGAVAESFTGPWRELGDAIAEAFKKTSDAETAYQRALANASTSADQLEELRQAFLAASAAEQALYVQQGQSAQIARQQLADLGVQAVATFAAALASGKSYTEAIAAIAPGLKHIGDSYAALGLNIEDAGLQQLVLAANVQETNPQLLAAAGAHAQSLQGLAQLGLLNVNTFAAMQRTGSELHMRLQAEFAGTEEGSRLALLPMQDYLHQAEIQAQALGVPLDENTQRLIDQSQELGIWREQGATAQDRLIAGMEAMVERVDHLLQAMMGFSGAITGLPDRRDIVINVTTNEQINRHVMETIEQLPFTPMAEGGMGRVTRPTLFLAGEAGSEDYAFSGGGRRFGDAPGGLEDLRQDFRELRREMARDRRLQPSLMAAAMRSVFAKAGAF